MGKKCEHKQLIRVWMVAGQQRKEGGSHWETNNLHKLNKLKML